MRLRSGRVVTLLLILVVTPIGLAVLGVGNPVQATGLLWLAELSIFLYLFLSHRDDRELTQELASLQYDPTDDSALEKSIDEGRETLDTQIDNLNDIDTKAIRILRINVLLIGIILSVLTFSSNTQQVGFAEFLNVYIGVGIGLLIFSTAAAALTYTASDFRAGMSKEDFVTMLDENLTDQELELVLSKSYAKWIHDNQLAEILNSFYSTLTILLLIYAVSYLSLGVYDALIRSVPFLLEGGTNVALLVITLISGFPSQVRRVIGETD